MRWVGGGQRDLGGGSRAPGGSQKVVTVTPAPPPPPRLLGVAGFVRLLAGFLRLLLTGSYGELSDVLSTGRFMST